MDNEFQIQRHKMLWDEKTKLTKRIVYGSFLFGFLIVVNVLAPYSEDLGERNELELEIKPYIEIIKNSQNKLKQFDKLENELKNIKEIIQKRTWKTEINKLIDRYRNINTGGGASWKVYQAEADKTIYSVASLVKKEVVDPIDYFIKNSFVSENLSPEFKNQFDGISKTIDLWVKENIGKRWYLTIDAKMHEGGRLTNTLDRKLESLSSKIDQEKTKLKNRLQILKRKVNELKNNPELINKKKNLEIIQKKMDVIMHEWVRGMISVDQMVQVFPFVIICLVIFMLSTALTATTHYRYLERALNLRQTTITDPSFSSLWVLTYRGQLGTIITVGVYVLFLICMFLFFEYGVRILGTWLQVRNAWFIDKDNINVIIWFCRIILALILIYLVIHPYLWERRQQFKEQNI